MTALPAPSRPRRTPVVLVVAAVAVVGYGVRLLVLLQIDGLLGSSAYDDGVYFSAAAAFVHGRWPYADFLFLQPPGVLLAGAPFAALGRVLGDPAGVITARLVWLGIGAANCALVALVASRRSWGAALIAGGSAACFYPLAYGERSTLLEPLATLLLLVAVLVRGRGSARAALLAGAVAGVSVDVKIWYLVPVLVLVAFPGHRLRFLAGAAGSAALVAAPFLLRAPEAMVRMVLLDQLVRPRQLDDTPLRRLVVLTGAPWTAGGDEPPPAVVVTLAVVIMAVVLAAAVAASRTPLGRRAVALLAASVALVLASPSFFTHYVALTGPWAALVLGIGAGELLSRFRSRALATGGAVLVAAVAVVQTLGSDLRPPVPTPSVAPIAAAAMRVEGCVRSDDPGLLAAIGVLSRDLDRGCALWPDVTGWTFDRPGFPTAGDERAGSAVWQRYVNDYLLGGDAVIVDRAGTGLSAASRQRIARLPVLARSGDLVLHAVPH